MCEYLDTIKGNIKNYNANAKEWKKSKITLDKMEKDYARFLEVYKTISCFEFHLIWYLRQLPKGYTHKYMKVVENNYRLYQQFSELLDSHVLFDTIKDL